MNFSTNVNIQGTTIKAIYLKLSGGLLILASEYHHSVNKAKSQTTIFPEQDFVFG